MNRAQWQKVESIFQGALERPADARSAYLRESCGSDTELRAEVEELLQQHTTDPDFLDAPLVEIPRDLPPISLTPHSDASAARIGQYRIVREIGAGGMGMVYLAVHEGPGFERPVAVKVIRRGLDTDDVLRRFQLERRILAALKHPNVAHLIDAGQTEDGRPYFVMDFVEGASIDQYCEREGLSIRQRLLLFRNVCDAVQHAHNNLVVHRDLKPSNILVSKEGVPVLLDFGIGKLLEQQPESGAEKEHTRTGMRAFTPEYAAPEQLRGEPASVATDVYGLGLLVYRMLTGHRPFDVGNGFEFEKAVLEKEPTKPSVHGGRQLAGDIDTIVLKALRKEPERRYSSVAALSDDIQRYLDGLPVRARADTFGYRTGKFVRRHRLALSSAAAVFIALVAATVYSRGQTTRVTLERDKALEVQSFLLEMFGSAGREKGDSVSIRQLLDAQAGQVEIAYADNPELRGQMYAVLAEGYDRLGLVAQAEPMARQALAVRRATLRSDHPDLASSTSLLGWIMHMRGRSKEGETLLREALALWDNARPANPSGHARTLNDLGVVREASGDYDEAGDLYRRALTIRRQLFGDTDRAVATTGSNLSVVLYRKGDIKGAVAVAESALAVMRKVAGADHQRSTVIQNNLAAFRVAVGDLAGAEAEYRDLIARTSRVQGRQHPLTVGLINGLGTVLRRQQRYAEAETLFVEALAAYEAAYGPEHARVATTAMMLGSTMSAQKRFGEARPLVERAIAILRKARGENHREVAQAISVLGVLHADAGNWAAAERAQRQAVATFERALGKQHLETATTRTLLARVVMSRGRPDEAYALYKEAHDAMVAGGMQPTATAFRETVARMAAADSARQRR